MVVRLIGMLEESLAVCQVKFRLVCFDGQQPGPPRTHPLTGVSGSPQHPHPPRTHPLTGVSGSPRRYACGR
jgi:hypothetical protein